MSLAPADAIPVAVDATAIADVVADRYERRGRELWGLARRLGASDEEAQDAVQEAHLRLWRELERGTAIADLDAWTFRVLYRLVMDQHRVARRVTAIVGRLRDRSAAVSHLDIDNQLSIWPIVDRLSDRQRTTVYLRYRVDLSFEQIGHVMGITPSAARAHATRALERLRELLGGAGEFAG